MKKSFLYSFVVLMVLLVASCAKQTQAPSDTVYLDELERKKQLEAAQRDENAQILDEYGKKKKILTRIEAEDKIVQKKLIQKQEDIEEKSAQLEKVIQEKLGFKSSEIARKNTGVQELLDQNLPPEELEKRLNEETSLNQAEITEIVETYKLQRMIAASQSSEELEEVLKEKTELKAEEIQRIVAIKQQVIDNQKALRQETLKKIHDRLVRNRRLNLEAVFCSTTSQLDQLVISPVYYPFDVHAVSNQSSTQLFADYEMISQELTKYPDMMIQLEGNCDYKGSNKYNKALGDRRWSGVMPLLASLGYPKGKIRGISKGEECPTTKFENDDAWRAENRRTDFVWVLK